MTASMQRFVSIANRMPDKRQAAVRRADFKEIFGDYAPAAAAEQSARCSQCGIPYCQIHCPLQNNIPDWLMLAAQGRLEEAYELSSATNNMPEICGRICPHDRLCEGTCVIETAGHGTVTIGAVERFITETAWTEGWVKPPTPDRELDHSVGVIGAGPAGLAAGEQLRRHGYQVHVYDRYDRIGGLLVYGIPNFKLEKEVVERRARLLADGGVVFHSGFERRPLALCRRHPQPPDRALPAGKSAVSNPAPLQVTLRDSARDSAEPDFSDVRRFFLANHSDYNKARGDHVLLERIEEHHFVIIEQAGAIVGVAGTFRHGRNGVYREAGATRITLNGFGLQKLTHYARSLHEHILEPGYQAYYSTVLDANHPSKHNMEQVGFVDWPDPPGELVAHRGAMVAPERKVDYMRLPDGCLADHAQALLALAAKPLLSRDDRAHPGQYETARLTLKLEILERHRAEVARIAGGGAQVSGPGNE